VAAGGNGYLAQSGLIEHCAGAASQVTTIDTDALEDTKLVKTTGGKADRLIAHMPSDLKGIV
jgi:hypothetical protein